MLYYPHMPSRHLILPDIHQRHLVAQQIIASVPHDHLILLGDYFDDFHDTPLHAVATAKWLADLLDAHPAEEGYLTCLMGNHDVAYRWPTQPPCSGNTIEKLCAIQQHMTDRHWDRIGFYTHAQGWLLSHAGFHSSLLSSPTLLPSPVNESVAIAAASAGNWHPWLGVGRDRGGYDPFGGVVWMDWGRFPATPGTKQIVGHTRGREVRFAEDNPKQGMCFEGKATRWCLDTHLNHYGVLEGGELTVGAVAYLV